MIITDDTTKNTMLEGIDIVYWINLDRAKERQSHMKNILTDEAFINIPNKRISAYDSKKGNIRKKFVLTPDLVSRNDTVTDQEYSCLFSHLEAIRVFSESDKETALILEDDVSIEYKKYWMKSIQDIMNDAPKDWEIIKLCSFQQVDKLTNKYTLWKPWQIDKKITKCGLSNGWIADWSCVAYLIRHKAAKKLIKELYHDHKYVLDNQYYHVADALLYQKLKTYIYKYPYFTVRDKYTSYINIHNKSRKRQLGNTKYRNELKQKAVHMYKRLFSRKNKKIKN